jgi:hypothetical protein
MDEITYDFLWMSVAPVRLRWRRLVGRSGLMGLARMRSRVLSSVSMVRMVVLEGYVPGRVVDELDSVCTGVMMSTVSGMARAIQRRMRLVAPDVG